MTATAAPSVSSSKAPAHPTRSGFSLGRMLAYSRREAQEIERDPVRLLFAFLGSALMMLAFGFGITTDVENIRFAYLDLDQSPESRAYLSTFEGSRYFVRHPPAQTQEELQRRLKSHEIEVALEVAAQLRPEPRQRRTWARSQPGWTAPRQTAPRAFASIWWACTTSS